MSEEGGGTTHRRGSSPPAAPASLPDDDDLLREILLRLPPQPSSLPRASAVCKRWRAVATDPKFLECFRSRHREPPLLGYYEWTDEGIIFSSVLDPPDRIHPQRFGLGDNSRNGMLGCRHGRVLVREFPRNKIWVLDPVTGELCGLDAPREFNPVAFFVKGAVLCAAADRSHVHGSCHSSPFKVVLVCIYGYWDPSRPIAFVYSSETGVWHNLPLAKAPSEQYHFANSGVVVGNVLYWSSMSTIGHMLSCSTPPAVLDTALVKIVEIDLDGQSLAVTKGPPSMKGSSSHQVIKAEDGDIGVAMLSYPNMEIWQRKVNCHGHATWLWHKTVDMDTILAPPPQITGARTSKEILDYDEDNGVFFLCVDTYVYMVQLEAMQSRKLSEKLSYVQVFHPFKSFYTPGWSGRQSSATASPKSVSVHQDTAAAAAPCTALASTAAAADSSRSSTAAAAAASDSTGAAESGPSRGWWMRWTCWWMPPSTTSPTDN